MDAVLSHIQQRQPGSSSLSVTLRWGRCSLGAHAGVGTSWRSGDRPNVSSFLVWRWGHLLPELVQGQTAARVLGPGPAFWESRDSMKWGWGSDCHQKMAQVQVFFALGPATYFKALSGPVPHQCFLGKPGSSVRNHLPTG